MRITFLNPPFHPMFSRESRSPCVTKSSTLYWPMFLSYAAGTVEADGNEIQLIDSPAMELDLAQTLDGIKKFDPELVVCSTSTPSILNDLKVVHAIKEALPKAKIAIMGTHATAEPLESMEMEPSLDFVIIGEADYTARNLARYLRGDIKDISSIAGLAFRKADGTVDFQPEGPKIENLDEIPWVSKVYRKYLYSCYKKYFYGANLNPLIVILSGRGCPNRCSYCVIPQTLNGHKFRRRSPKDVVDELQYRVGDGGAARVRHQGAALPGQQPLQDPGAALLFVVLMVAHQGLFDPQVVQQLQGHAGVLGGDEVRRLQGLGAAPGNVPQIADGRGDQV